MEKKKKKITKIEKLLRKLERSKDGMTFTEMQKFMFGLTYPQFAHFYDKRVTVTLDGVKLASVVEDPHGERRRFRGWWCTTFAKIFPLWMKKLPNGRWVLNGRKIEPPFTIDVECRKAQQEEYRKIEMERVIRSNEFWSKI